MSDSVRPHRWQPTTLPRPWDSPGKNTGVGCHFLLQCTKVKSESEVAQWVKFKLRIYSHEGSCFSDTKLPGTSTGDPTHDKVMRRRPDRQGGSGLEGLPGPARALTPKPKSVCLPFTILCLSPTLLTLTGGYPRPPLSEENQLKALVNKSPGLERSIFTLIPLLLF